MSSRTLSPRELSAAPAIRAGLSPVPLVGGLSVSREPVIGGPDPRLAAEVYAKAAYSGLASPVAAPIGCSRRSREVTIEPHCGKARPVERGPRGDVLAMGIS